MKKIIVIFFAFVFIGLSSCKESKQPVNPADELANIENILDQYVIANENQDLSLIEKIWASDEDIILIGTNSDEKLVGWKAIKKAIKNQFKEFKDTYIAVSDQIIKINDTGNTAWFSELLNYNFIYNGKAQSFEGIRFTGVLEKKENNWEIVQGHLSIPVSVEIEETKK
ncbi:MAG: nuclear transport factor 2 family protein [Bacteroidetes bacterium]|nr:nuclear transport factor 2 family protein [Bacteroidota bacterium]MCK4287632.1 nuclear transport factor 2 family protein [Bacteroidales bacterium]